MTVIIVMTVVTAVVIGDTVVDGDVVVTGDCDNIDSNDGGDMIVTILTVMTVGIC